MHLTRPRIWHGSKKCQPVLFEMPVETAQLSIDWFVQLGTVFEFLHQTDFRRNIFLKMKSFWTGCGCQQQGETTLWIRYQPSHRPKGDLCPSHPNNTMQCNEVSFQFEKYWTSLLLCHHCASTLEAHWCPGAWPINKSPTPIYCPKSLGSPFLSIPESAH